MTLHSHDNSRRNASNRIKNPCRGLAILGILTLGLPALASDQAGVSAAVHGDVALTRAQVVPGRAVASGEPILAQDGLHSGPSSGMQILLLDHTVFTLGPDTNLVVDEFVYDPRTDTGKLTASITRGVFRFVSGRIAASHPEDMNVNLLTGTLGVRGTMVAGSIDPVTNTELLVLLGEGHENDAGAPSGEIEVCNVGHCVQVRRPGFGTRIETPDSPPIEPFPVPRDELERLTRSVSTPFGRIEKAESVQSKAPDVAAGPEKGDTRSPAEVSGKATASGFASSDGSLASLYGRSTLDFASTLPQQSQRQEVVVGQEAVFEKKGVSFDSGGSYDFSLRVDLGQRNLDLKVQNISAPTLGINGESIVKSGVPFGATEPVIRFDQTGSLQGSPTTCLAAGCTGYSFGYVVGGNGRPADSVYQVLKIVPNALDSEGKPVQANAVVTDPAAFRIQHTAP